MAAVHGVLVQQPGAPHAKWDASPAIARPPPLRTPEKNRANVYNDAMHDACPIEHDIPLPPDARTGVSKYPFDQMAVNDSLKARTSLGALSQAILRYRKRHGLDKRFTVRNIGNGFARCWRLA